MRIKRRLLVWIALGAAIMGFAQGQGKAEATWPPKTFPITFWCGPPDPYITVEQYKRIAQAGFTVVGPPCEGAATVERNRKILETAHDTGLMAIIADTRMPVAITGNPKAEDALKAIVADYRRYPALLGYFLVDEPGANSFAGLAQVVAELHKLDPGHLVYINLFPNYASTDRMVQPSQLNTLTYDDYLTKFMQVVKPDVLSWDHYFFLTTGDRPGFYGNLAAGQRAAASTQPPTPFWQIVLSTKHGGYRLLTENELRFEATQTLVYGAHGLSYFTYWHVPGFDQAIINQDGTPGPLYEPAKRVNQEVKALAKWLYGAYVLRTFQTGDVPPDGRPRPDDVPIKVTGPGNLSVGLFRDEAGYLYILVTNRDYKQAVETQVVLDAGEHAIQKLDIVKNHWNGATGPKDSDGETTLALTLGPADAALIRWQ